MSVKWYTYILYKKPGYWARYHWGFPVYVGVGWIIGAGRCQRMHIAQCHMVEFHYHPDEATAYAYEAYLIDFWGRKNNDTGILENKSDGGLHARYNHEHSKKWIPHGNANHIHHVSKGIQQGCPLCEAREKKMKKRNKPWTLD
jgi:hypothetical protein